MQTPNFNNYQTAFEITLSRFKATMDNIQESDVREETHELQNINRLHTKLNATIQSHSELQKMIKKDYTGVDFEECTSILKNIATSGIQEKRLTEQEELKEKLDIMDKATLLKHFTSSVVVEVNDTLIGVKLNKTSGKVETIFVPYGEGTKKDLLKQINDNIETTSE